MYTMLQCESVVMYVAFCDLNCIIYVNKTVDARRLFQISRLEYSLVQREGTIIFLADSEIGFNVTKPVIERSLIFQSIEILKFKIDVGAAVRI